MRPAIVMVSLLSLCTAGYAQEIRGQIISAPLAQRYGLKQSWLAQAQIDRATDQMAGFALEGDGLFVLSQGGTLQALDAETGGTRWIIQLGVRVHPATGPGVGERYVAMTKGSTLYVLDRSTGALVFERSLQQAPMASPAVWGHFVYVPLFNSMIVAYDLAHPKASPWFYRGAGQLTVPPLVTPHCLAWTTNRGHIYASPPDRLEMRFQFRANAPIVSPLSNQPPLIYATSRDGFTYALDESNGKLVWRFAAGDPISHSPVAIRDSVFVIPEVGGIYCLAAGSGQQRWFAPQAKQFVAASPSRMQPRAANGNPPAESQAALGRIYAVDDAGNMLILDASSGARLDTIPTAGVPWKFTNHVNDRLYFGSKSGLIQCLHEIGLNTPTSYAPPMIASPPGETLETPDTDSTDDEPAEFDPFDEP